MTEEDTSPKLNNEGIKCVQDIVGALLYYAQAVHNRLIVGLSAIGAQQVSATEQTAAAINQILDHVATYLNYGITNRASDMILEAHSDAGFNNKSKARSRDGAQIFIIKRPNDQVEGNYPHNFPNHQIYNIFSR